MACSQAPALTFVSASSSLFVSSKALHLCRCSYVSAPVPHIWAFCFLSAAGRSEAVCCHVCVEVRSEKKPSVAGVCFVGSTLAPTRKALNPIHYSRFCSNGSLPSAAVHFFCSSWYNHRVMGWFLISLGFPSPPPFSPSLLCIFALHVSRASRLVAPL